MAVEVKLFDANMNEVPAAQAVYAVRLTWEDDRLIKSEWFTAQKEQATKSAASFSLYGLEPAEKDDEDAWELSSTPDVIADAVKLAQQAMEQGK